MTKVQEYESLVHRIDCGTEILHSYAPIIGICGNFKDGECTLAQAYYMSIVHAGGSPVIIPPYVNEKSLISLLDTLDGIVFSGGADIDPEYLCEEPLEGVSINPARDLPELIVIKLAVERNIPILGICRGIQMLAAALGGRLYQDLCTQHAHPIEHNQKEARAVATHEVSIESDSLLYSLFKRETLSVNSFHHQAVRDVPSDFKITAVAPDGIIEAMEATNGRQIIGVQWHPECFILDNNHIMMPLFEWLIEQSMLYSRAKKLQDKCLVLDSHCDSPMFFDKGARFCNTNSGIEVEYDYVGETSPHGDATFIYTPLVDLHKMFYGHLDVSFMVAYLKQRGRDRESLCRAVEYADRLLTLIDNRIGECNSHASIATTPRELYENKSKGIKSVVKGIENGYALGLDADNVERFNARGVAYMTLCHNGDNDICDSHKGLSEHNGLSPFGKQVIERMNRVGMMVDLSHASDKSFYDALECSSKPIICSHSSSRTLCNHTRNLTDEQMRALASVGGVAQVCLYGGFLKQDGIATIDDAVRHILYMIEVMGIEHVGIGSDFDGGGGIIGMDDASCFILLTERLLAHGLSDSDLSLILGENFIRVWKENRGE